MASKKVASSFVHSLTRLDALIHRLEINTGVPHRPSPFAWLTGVGNQPETLTEKSAKAPQPGNESSEQKNPSSKQAAAKEEHKKTVEKPATKQEGASKNEESKAAPPKEAKEEKEIPPGTLEDYSKMDIRVGRIVECWKHPESDKLWCEKIDIGSEIREIASGLQKFVPHEQMSGLVLVLVNLKARKLAGFNSNGMVLCASNQDHSQVELLRPDPSSTVGERVVIEGFEGLSQAFEKVINPKDKVLEKCTQVLKTDAELCASYLDRKLKTKAGVIKSQTLANSYIS